MNKMKIEFELNQINKIVKDIFIPKMDNINIFTFKGPLGAGKTTLIKEILKDVGVSEVITSPTFAYVNTYTNDKGQTFHHFDLYRLDSLESFLSLGFDEYLYQKDSYCFIEWPEIINELLDNLDLNKKKCCVTLSFYFNDKDKRALDVE
jgi:tRNA threonylcarbamoyladenosine biosynthesis protein TsaE